ncbi:hypothetical protein ACM66B_004648 [Microbotryomycetes sp. NB124-2]
MRQKRVKTYRKVMQLYCSAFKFREPYQVLIDGAFVESCVNQKLDILARLHDVLQGNVKPMITQCSMQQLYDKGEQSVIDAAKAFERRKCNHLKAKPEQECLMSMAGSENPNRYVLATQSLDLRKKLRAVPGLPLVYISRSVMLLESPSDQTLAKKIRMERQKLHVPASEMALLKGQPVPSGSSHIVGAESSTAEYTDATSNVGGENGAAAAEHEGVEQKKQKRKGPKGPNPLSVKKKVKAADNNNGNASKKRSRDGSDDESTRQDRAEQKRKRVENESVKVASLAKRGELREGDQARKKRKRSKKKKGGEGTDAGGEGQEKTAGGEAA